MFANIMQICNLEKSTAYSNGRLPIRPKTTFVNKNISKKTTFVKNNIWNLNRTCLNGVVVTLRLIRREYRGTVNVHNNPNVVFYKSIIFTVFGLTGLNCLYIRTEYEP